MSTCHMERGTLRSVNSPPSTLTMGVPQGSVLGPVLFIIYVNGLSQVLNGFYAMYADDLSVVVSHPSCQQLEQSCAAVLADAASFFSDHDLYLNKAKTELMRFGNWQRGCDDLFVVVGGETLATGAADLKFLGIHIDKHLSWKPHCEHLISKLSSLAYQFRNLRTVLDESQLVALYYAQVESRLRYGVCLWGSSTLFPRVFVSQKRILRCIAGVPRGHTCRTLFERYRLLTLPAVYMFEICLYIYSNKHKFLRVCDKHNLNTRHKNDLYLPLTKYLITGKSPDYLGVRLFNKLPADITSVVGCARFKRKLKSFLLSRCPYAVSDILNE